MKTDLDTAKTNLEIEKQKNRYLICFVDSDRVERQTIAFDPFISKDGEDGFAVVTSEERAWQVIRAIYKVGFVNDEDDITYPVSSLRKIFVKLEGQ